jgi:hypothetical protein
MSRTGWTGKFPRCRTDRALRHESAAGSGRHPGRIRRRLVDRGADHHQAGENGASGATVLPSACSASAPVSGTPRVSGTVGSASWRGSRHVMPEPGCEGHERRSSGGETLLSDERGRSERARRAMARCPADVSSSTLVLPLRAHLMIRRATRLRIGWVSPSTIVRQTRSSARFILASVRASNVRSIMAALYSHRDWAPTLARPRTAVVNL